MLYTYSSSSTGILINETKKAEKFEKKLYCGSELLLKVMKKNENKNQLKRLLKWKLKGTVMGKCLLIIHKVCLENLCEQLINKNVKNCVYCCCDFVIQNLRWNKEQKKIINWITKGVFSCGIISHHGKSKGTKKICFSLCIFFSFSFYSLFSLPPSIHSSIQTSNKRDD